jgi:pimeloyl-ACP methyl ester carboxylesterase
LAQRAFAPDRAAREALPQAQDLFSATAEVLRADFAACDAFDVSARVGEVRTPCVVAVGEGDRLTPPAKSQALAGALPNARLVVVPSAGHMLPYEQAQPFAAVLAAAFPASPAKIDPRSARLA